MERRRRPSNGSGEEAVLRVLKAAIKGKSCSICLNFLSDCTSAVLAVCNHAYCLDCIRRWSYLKRKCPLCNADFDSWFYDISFLHRSFLLKKLPTLFAEKKLDQQRLSSSRSSRSRPLPWRRSFGERVRTVGSDVAAERKLQWRASVYKRRLEAVPLASSNCSHQCISRKKKQIMQRIEPWIRRELQAILSDPDPSVIVHVASSLFIASLEKYSQVQSSPLVVEENFLSPLRPFLQDDTTMFWHELRCFAGSSFPMQTYDSVVEYKKLD